MAKLFSLLKSAADGAISQDVYMTQTFDPPSSGNYVIMRPTLDAQTGRDNCGKQYISGVLQLDIVTVDGNTGYQIAEDLADTYLGSTYSGDDYEVIDVTFGSQSSIQEADRKWHTILNLVLAAVRK